MRPALYLDANISPRVAERCRSLGLDTLALAEDPGIDMTAPDETVLERATALGRWLVTYDREDFQRLAQTGAHEGRRYRGIIVVSPLVPGSDFAGLARRLAELAAATPDVEAYGFVGVRR